MDGQPAGVIVVLLFLLFLLFRTLSYFVLLFLLFRVNSYFLEKSEPKIIFDRSFSVNFGKYPYSESIDIPTWLLLSSISWYVSVGRGSY